jgi:hypothetical protein
MPCPPRPSSFDSGYDSLGRGNDPVRGAVEAATVYRAQALAAPKPRVTVRQVWRDHQPSHRLCTDAMEAAGLQVYASASPDPRVCLSPQPFFSHVRRKVLSENIQ